MDKKGWIIFSVVCVALLGFLVWNSGNGKVDVSDDAILKPQAASADNGQIAEHTFGKTDSKVTLIEYGDFQCPGCGSAEPTVKQIREKYQDKVLFIFRNMPLGQMHPNALAAASAVEAAGMQGKYWEMHELMYQNQNDWNTLAGDKRSDKFASYAEQLGLKKDKFLTDASSKEVSQKIKFDRAIASKANVDETPTFILNGKKMDGSLWNSVDKVSEEIDKALK